MAEIKVIVAGAGIAGLATAISLRQLNSSGHNFNVHLYERAPELKEIGASIALSPNGLRTLERFGIENALDDNISYRGPSALPMIYRHWKTNEIVSVDQFADVPDHRHQTARFHRAHLHDALLQHVPRESIHLNKETISAEADSNGVTLFFKDGTSVNGDILIGADGLRSKVRTTFNPDHKLHWTGRTLFRSTFDYSLVKDIPDLPPDSTHWWGPKTTFFASRLGRNMYTTVGSFDPRDYSKEDPESVRWDQVADVSPFKDLYKEDWNPVVKALAEATPYVRLYPNFAGEPLASWVFGSRVTLIGDAAHTHGGSHAAGGSLALDDAWALYLSFKQVLATVDPGQKPTSQDIHQALTLYDNTRRPHTTRLINGVLGSANAVNPVTDEELRQRMTSRASTIWLTEHDVNAAFTKVLQDEGLIPSISESGTGPLLQPRIQGQSRL
ncbi:salicylate hydroxylase [Exophiala viscosa]|uniref:salicylate hydroxylase n=1 Tax=Exophiala viscosa TaxID=2486360 RepID=UPI00219423CC|nr:salicylate hydroxylase [Exophiala viscosa]